MVAEFLFFGDLVGEQRQEPVHVVEAVGIRGYLHTAAMARALDLDENQFVALQVGVFVVVRVRDQEIRKRRQMIGLVALDIEYQPGVAGHAPLDVAVEALGLHDRLPDVGAEHRLRGVGHRGADEHRHRSFVLRLRHAPAPGESRRGHQRDRQRRPVPARSNPASLHCIPPLEQNLSPHRCARRATAPSSP